MHGKVKRKSYTKEQALFFYTDAIPQLMDAVLATLVHTAKQIDVVGAAQVMQPTGESV